MPLGMSLGMEMEGSRCFVIDGAGACRGGCRCACRWNVPTLLSGGCDRARGL